MFSNIVATGQYAWAPSAGICRDDNVGVDEDPNANDEQPDLEEGSGDLEEDGILNFTDDVCNMVRGVNMSSSNNTRSSGKRKERERLDVQSGKKKVLELGCNYCHGLITWLTVCQTIVIPYLYVVEIGKGCSIPEVMTELHSIAGVHIGDDFHAYATEFLGIRRNREMWFSMGSLENKMKWL